MQFIVTDFSILQAGGQSLFRFKVARNAKFELAIAEATPFNCSTRGGGAKVPYSCYIQSEIWNFLRKSENPCGRWQQTANSVCLALKATCTILKWRGTYMYIVCRNDSHRHKSKGGSYSREEAASWECPCRSVWWQWCDILMLTWIDKQKIVKLKNIHVHVRIQSVGEVHTCTYTSDAFS